ncbi:YEATS domain-containing protein 4 [Cloeon dipterum]|uniref:YEATS domain-containing protein 4 n=1 Tax=Cloeon dipterum TaxID=197152 RepID=UPI00321FCCA0
MAATVSEYGPDSGGRNKGVTIVKPIVYGNFARYFGKKREEDGHTHQWTVYVKPYANEDMSTYIKKVLFKLHESYPNPSRVVTRPPYEITETGWGEFEITIKIHFHDPNERPVTLYHILKLFQTGPEVMLAKKSVVSEYYEEIVFQDPTALMHTLLTTPHQLTMGTWKHDTDFEERKEKGLQRILYAKEEVKREINNVKEKVTLYKDAVIKIKADIASLQQSPSSSTLTAV